MTEHGASEARLRAGLAARGDAMRAYLGEALFHAQVDFTCQLLDVVDEVVSPATAERVTDAVCERLAVAGAAAAAERAAAFEAETQRRMAAGSPAARREMLRYTRDNGGLLSPRALAELQALETLEELQAGG